MLALHVLGLWLWLTSAGYQRSVPPSSTLAAITVWLQTLPPTPTEEPKAEVQRQRSTPAEPRLSNPQTPAAGTPLATAPEPADTAAQLPEGPSAPAQPAPSRALSLTLPRSTLSTLAAPSLAAQTPFHGRLSATVERQIATVAAESGPWMEERLDYDHVRLRRGNTCVMLERPAASRIDPSNDALQRLPWLANVSRCP